MVTIESLKETVETLTKENTSLKDQLKNVTDESQLYIDILIKQREQAANAAAMIQKDLMVLQARQKSPQTSPPVPQPAPEAT